MDKFILANKIANFACELDWDKSILSEEDRNSVHQVVEKLHDLAESISGDRASELYSTR